MGEKRNAYRLLAGKTEGRRKRDRPRRRWEDEMNLRGVGSEILGWI
jgi:hypothetical protein